MTVAVPQLIVKPFAVDADPAYRNDIPTDQPLTPAGAASLSLGFPPQTFQPISSGGVPPAGKDFNGILYMLSSYAVWLQAGGGFYYDTDFVAENGGYPADIILRSSVAGKFWYNTLADNANDPDLDDTGWIGYSVLGSPTGVQTAAPGAGSFSVALNPGVGFLDITPSAAADLLNVTGASDGQILTITNLSGSFALTVLDTNFRMSGDLGLIQNNSATFRYSSALALWVAFNG